MHILTFVCYDLVRLEEKGSVLQVHDLAFQLVLHHVNKGQLVTQVLNLRIELLVKQHCRAGFHKAAEVFLNSETFYFFFSICITPFII